MKALLEASEVLGNQEATEVLSLAIDHGLKAVMSHLTDGTWHITEIILHAATDETLRFEVTQEEKRTSFSIKPEQPVGVSFRYESQKYVFETVVVDFNSTNANKTKPELILSAPEKIEKMLRRADLRVQTPDSLNVKAMFWHRGYTDDSNIEPSEDYWQGKLVDLSLGGTQVYIDKAHEANFRVNQLIGLQFTPMPYQRPILLEGRIKHLTQAEQQHMICLGIQFLGLEISNHGRERLGRLIETVSEYHKTNQENGDNSDQSEEVDTSFTQTSPKKDLVK